MRKKNVICEKRHIYNVKPKPKGTAYKVIGDEEGLLKPLPKDPVYLCRLDYPVGTAQNPYPKNSED